MHKAQDLLSSIVPNTSICCFAQKIVLFIQSRISDFDADHKIEFRQLRDSTADKFSVCCCFGTTGP
eukprot:m.91759 g.91759  ORF g.91759 m.91759 type:complete len:66 (-) comp11981_c0_seq1:5714-5911(-)